ncbi:MAG: 3-dehydroquinate synthase [Actinobacteria bacterium]|nr:3-dehydroquinate synthase [Actinomycetota bacterium]
MNTISVAAERTYNVTLDCSWEAQLPHQRELVFLVPESLRNIAGDSLKDFDLIFLPDGENQKTITNYAGVLEELAKRNLGRDGVLVGLGGGATTDLTGFVAATYLRGIDWIAVPTTVAGMVDAAIGGKTGINLQAGKNLAGAFHSPISVLIDYTWLKTLPQRDINAGLAEAVKCGFIADPTILELFQSNVEANIKQIVSRAVSVKANVVSQDFKESFHREILNYGHTLGHAIEWDSGYELRHGEAISIGMVYAAALSAKYSNLPGDVVTLHQEILQSLELPITYSSGAWSRLYETMLVDKKARNNQIRFVLLESIGSCRRGEGISEEELRKIYLEMIGE